MTGFHAPLRIAHRGMPRLARENTLASFALALAAGAGGIELDVHATADDVVVVHHDPTLENGVAIRNLDHARLLRETPWASQIPTLGEVCALVHGRAELFVEIKGDGIEGLVSDILSADGGTCAIHSFDHALIGRLSRSGTSIPLGILYENTDADPLRLMSSCGAVDLWPHHPLVTRALVDDVHSAGGRVIPWTVNVAGDVRRLTGLRVDGICTDDVSLLARG